MDRARGPDRAAAAIVVEAADGGGRRRGGHLGLVLQQSTPWSSTPPIGWLAHAVFSRTFIFAGT